MVTAIDENTKTSLPLDAEIEGMMKAGVHLGHGRAKRNAGMLPYLWSVRSNVDIIDLAATKEKLKQALEFVRRLSEEGKIILLTGTRPSSKNAVRLAADELGLPWVNQRWIGGSLTNFKVIRRRIESLAKMEEEKAAGGFDKYTKVERIKKEEEMARLRNNFEGLRRMERVPDALFIVDIAHDSTALREAKILGIPVVAVIDTNTDPRTVDYPIPGNNDAKTAVAYVLDRVKEAIEEGRHHPAPAGETANESSAGGPAADSSKKEGN